jgi:hypothetical protein
MTRQQQQRPHRTALAVRAGGGSRIENELSSFTFFADYLWVKWMKLMMEGGVEWVSLVSGVPLFPSCSWGMVEVTLPKIPTLGEIVERQDTRHQTTPRFTRFTRDTVSD